MNFQDVRNAAEKQWVDNVDVTVLNIVNAPQDQWLNHIQEVLGKDSLGEDLRFRLQTKFADGLLDNNDLNRTMPFKLKWFNKAGGYGIQGYPLKPKKAGPAPPLGPPPQTPAPAQNQYPRQQQPKARDYDKENRGKCRFGLYCATIQAGCTPDALNNDVPLLQAIEELVQKSMNGLGGLPNPDYVGEPEPDF